MEHNKQKKRVIFGEPGTHGFTFSTDDFGGRFKKFSKAMAGDDCCGTGSFNLAKNFSFNRSVHQIVKDETLKVIIHAPGMDKESIKLRAKSDKLTFTGKLRNDLAELLENEKEFKSVIQLHETVDPNQAKADFRDGVMIVSFPVVEQGENIEFD